MLTPVEIRNQHFKRSLRGYEPESVKAFLNALSEEWGTLQHKCEALEKEVTRMKEEQQSVREMEIMLQQTLKQAEQSSASTLENAQKEAELQLREAEIKSKEMITESIEQAKELRKEVRELEAIKENLVFRLKMLLQAQLEKLHSFEQLDDFSQQTSNQPAE